MKSIVRNSVYNVFYQALNILFPLITSVYVSRIIMEDGIGKVAYAQNISSYFLSFAMLGFPAYGIREIAKVNDCSQDKNIAFSEMFWINTISTTIAFISYLMLVSLTPKFRANIQLFLCTGILIALNYINIDWLYQGQEDYAYITKRSTIIKILSIVAMLVFVNNRNDYIKYALITSLGTACNYFFNILHARRYVKLVIKGCSLVKHIKPLAVLTVMAFFGNIYNRIDITMLGMMSTEAIVGYYSIAHKIILIGVTCCQAVSAVLLPRLSYYSKNDSKELNRLVEFGIKCLFAIIIPATIGMLLLADDGVIFLYGKSFASVGQTLAIFSPMLIIRPLGDLLCYQLLISVGEEKRRLFASLIASIINIILNAILIPMIAQNGAALASVVSEILVNGILLRFALKYVQIKIEYKYLYKVFFATGIMVIVISLVKYLQLPEIHTLLFSVVFGVIVYIAVSYVTKNEIFIELSKRLIKH